MKCETKMQSNGLWLGSVRVLEAATNVILRIDDRDGTSVSLEPVSMCCPLWTPIPTD